jgi:hypothetical protein
MPKPYIRKGDRGTGFAQALTHAHQVGYAHCSEDEAMAGFCENLPFLVGAVSSRLVWEGAVAYGLQAQDLMKIAHDHDLAWLDALQFDPPFVKLDSRTNDIDQEVCDD